MSASGLNTGECCCKRHLRTFMAIEPGHQPREMPIDVGDQVLLVQFLQEFDHAVPLKQASRASMQARLGRSK